ncbi:hypothetical protein D9M73_216080 [compost metagenome]
MAAVAGRSAPLPANRGTTPLPGQARGPRWPGLLRCAPGPAALCCRGLVGCRSIERRGPAPTGTFPGRPKRLDGAHWLQRRWRMRPSCRWHCPAGGRAGQENASRANRPGCRSKRPGYPPRAVHPMSAPGRRPWSLQRAHARGHRRTAPEKKPGHWSAPGLAPAPRYGWRG